MKDEDVGRTYLQYYIQITAGLHTEGLFQQQDQAGVQASLTLQLQKAIDMASMTCFFTAWKN